jgi:hypothetical protein
MTGDSGMETKRHGHRQKFDFSCQLNVEPKRRVPTYTGENEKQDCFLHPTKTGAQHVTRVNSVWIKVKCEE